MKELALHILDLAENSLRAGATELEITIERDEAADRLTVHIADNGRGMPPEALARVSDPFYTTKGTRRTGLGIPLATHAAQRAGGSFSIESQEGRGTPHHRRVSAQPYRPAAPGRYGWHGCCHTAGQSGYRVALCLSLGLWRIQP